MRFSPEMRETNYSCPCVSTMDCFFPSFQKFFPLAQVVSSLALNSFLLKTQGGPSTMLGALSVQLFPFLLFCPVNSSCLSLPRPPVLSPQLRETSGFAWVFLAVLQPGNSPGNRKGQVQVPSFCSLLSEVTILH